MHQSTEQHTSVSESPTIITSARTHLMGKYINFVSSVFRDNFLRDWMRPVTGTDMERWHRWFRWSAFELPQAVGDELTHIPAGAQHEHCDALRHMRSRRGE